MGLGLPTPRFDRAHGNGRTPSWLYHWLAVSAICVLFTAAVAFVTGSAGASTAASARLARYPYLTDVTANSVRITYAATAKITSATGTVRLGRPSGARSCTLTRSSAAHSGNTMNAPIRIAGATDYVVSTTISGLRAGRTYCYRVYTGGASSVNLLGSHAAPRFTTLARGSSMTFDVFGDWGDNSISGGTNQRRLDALIARSGAQFAVSTGDIGYSYGTQNNYGNLTATGFRVSQVFGPSYWKAPGSSIPLFSTAGNHGRSATFFQNWPQPATVAASGGKYRMETYSGQDRTTAVKAPSDWYAFTAGNARFYVLDADWSDNNVGTAGGGPYQVDRDFHWQRTSPEYKWLRADLAKHRTALKFAFFHFPLRSDSATESSDTYLQSYPNYPWSIGTLEGLLYNNGVKLAFNGHAHIYQRNVARPGAVTSYVTGGGGAKAVPVYSGLGGRACSPTDAYAIGWGYTSSVGSACGAAKKPSSDAQVYHFLKVTVRGTSVTVTPTNAAGSTFDRKTYNFGANTARPAAPSGVSATAAGSSVRLNWTRSQSSDVSALDVYRNARFLATVVPGALSYTDTAPVAGARYWVRAHDLAGNESVGSRAVRVSTP